MNKKNLIFSFLKRFSRKRYWFLLVLFFLPVWFFIIAPLLLRIPDDFHYQADIISVDNFYDEALGDYSGEQYSNTVFSYNIVDKKGPVLTIKNTFHVTAPDGRTIFKTEPLYGINRFTGMHTPGFGDKNRDGFLFAPRGLNKNETFQYWHVSNNKSVTMKYVGERFLYGIHVFRYQSQYEGPFDQTEFMHHLSGVPEARGIKLGSIIDMWIEPVSGYVVKIEDYSKEYYYFDIKTGQKIAPYNQFLNTYTEKSVRDHVKAAFDARNRVIVVQFVVPTFLLFFLLFGFIFYRFPDFFLFSSKYFFPSIVFILGIGFTIFVFFFSQNNIRTSEYNLFSQQSTEIKNIVEEKMNIYTNVLSGGKGFFDASVSVERDEWRAYVDSLNIQKTYPGIQGIGFARVILPQDKDIFESAVKREGFSDFHITPEGARDIYTSIVFLEPFDERNKRAFGYDMFSENVRRKAMTRARDTGLPALSGKVILKQETDSDVQNGFLLYVPVYKNKNIFGYVYAPFRAKDFVTSAVDFSRYDIEFQIFDGLRTDNENKLYTSDFFPEEKDELSFRDIKTLSLAGHPWTIEFVNSPRFTRSLIYIRLSYGILALGFLISFLCSYMLYSLMASRQKAVDYANKLNRKLIKNVQELELTRDQTLHALRDVEIQKDKFQKANTRLKLATRSAHIGVWEWDIVHDKLLWDTQMYALYGYKKDEFVGKAYDAWYASIHPEDKEKVDLELKKSLRTKQAFDMKFRIIWPDTSIHDIRAFGLVQANEKGTPIHMVGVNWDITQEALVDRQKTEFVSIASHELRTPLTAVSWYTEMILDEKNNKLSNSQKKYLREIYQGNQVMIELVNKLLNVSRIELGTLKVESKETDISRIALDVLGDQQKNIKSKKLVIKKQFDRIDPQMSDPTLVRIIFQNLLANAVKYTPAGGQICLSLRKKEDSLLIQVSDTGRGIPLSAQKDIFHKFFRAENTRDVKGTGLGLYIVNSMVEKLQGSISFESICSDDKKGRRKSGTTFSVILPLHSKKSS